MRRIVSCSSTQFDTTTTTTTFTINTTTTTTTTTTICDVELARKLPASDGGTTASSAIACVYSEQC